MKRGRSERYALEKEQVVALLREARTVEDKLILKLMVELGMRVGEVAHLQADWVREGEIRIPISRSCDCPNCKKNNGEWRAKSQASVRSIPVPPDMREDLFKVLRESPEGFHLTRQAIWWKVKQIATRAKIKVRGLSKDTIFPHIMRATAATRFASSLTASELCYTMGWANLEMGQHYINIAQAKAGAHRKIKEMYGS